MISREDLTRFVDGHRAAEAHIREETVKRLRLLTVDEARAEYESLCHVWETAVRSPADEQAINRLGIEDRVALRRRFVGTR